MTCITDTSLGPCHNCNTITDGSWTRKDAAGRSWIIGYECPKCKEK